MPTYDYKCDNCGHSFELFQSMKDKVKRKCPECGKNALQRLIGTGGAILFKGSGFYETDYRSASYKKAAEAERKETSDTKSESSNGQSTSSDKSSSSSQDGTQKNTSGANSSAE